VSFVEGPLEFECRIDEQSCQPDLKKLLSELVDRSEYNASIIILGYYVK
jgi:hypothetical protein